MNRRRLELSLDLLRELNRARLLAARGQWPHVHLAEQLLEQHDADARARADVRQTSIFSVLTFDHSCACSRGEACDGPGHPTRFEPYAKRQA